MAKESNGQMRVVVALLNGRAKDGRRLWCDGARIIPARKKVKEKRKEYMRVYALRLANAVRRGAVGFRGAVLKDMGAPAVRLSGGARIMPAHNI